ncbi:MAG: RNA-binding S4 domain-containing protein [Gammaproteobacteria bacterium]|nr:MAG: RNA-binding S4 domain-containing protein [Gammaproteobacteria bacterium]
MQQDKLDQTSSVRLDKWLWAARFYKTRPAAREAIAGGKVHLNGLRVKPARVVKTGDRLEITRGNERFSVTVIGISDRRGPAKIAETLYDESEESVARRAREREERALRRRVAPVPPERRPDKRSRRRIIRFTRGQED